MWIGPFQFNNPNKGISSMDKEDIAGAIVYGTCFGALLGIMLVKGFFGPMAIVDIFFLLLLLNRLGLWTTYLL